MILVPLFSEGSTSPKKIEESVNYIHLLYPIFNEVKNRGFAQDSMHSTTFVMAFKSPNGYAGKSNRLFAKKKVLVAKRKEIKLGRSGNRNHASFFIWPYLR